MRNLTASDRSALIRLAASLPVGDENRRTILAGLSGTSVRIAADGPKGKVKVSIDTNDRTKKPIKEFMMDSSDLPVLTRALDKLMKLHALDKAEASWNSDAKKLGLKIKLEDFATIRGGDDVYVEGVTLSVKDSDGQVWSEDGSGGWEAF